MIFNIALIIGILIALYIVIKIDRHTRKIKIILAILLLLFLYSQISSLVYGEKSGGIVSSILGPIKYVGNVVSNIWSKGEAAKEKIEGIVNQKNTSGK